MARVEGKADASLILSVGSIVLSSMTHVAFALHAHWHWAYFVAKREQNGLERAERMWAVFGHFKLVSAILAVCSIVLAMIALRAKKSWLSAVAAALALAACATIPLAV